MKFKLGQNVVATRSGKAGTVEAIHIDAKKGTQYDVATGANTSKSYRYLEVDLISESAHKKAQSLQLKAKAKAEKVAKAPIAKMAAKPAKVKPAAKPVKKAAKAATKRTADKS